MDQLLGKLANQERSTRSTFNDNRFNGQKSVITCENCFSSWPGAPVWNDFLNHQQRLTITRWSPNNLVAGWSVLVAPTVIHWRLMSAENPLHMPSHYDDLAALSPLFIIYLLSSNRVATNDSFKIILNLFEPGDIHPHCSCPSLFMPITVITIIVIAAGDPQCLSIVNPGCSLLSMNHLGQHCKNPRFVLACATIAELLMHRCRFKPPPSHEYVDLIVLVWKTRKIYLYI